MHVAERMSMVSGILAAEDVLNPPELSVSHLLGPIVVGVLLNSFVYGIVFLHWVQYTLGNNRDSRHVRYVLTTLATL